MNTCSHVRWTMCAAIAIGATGCRGLPGHTLFSIQLVSGQHAVTSIQLGSEKCILWSTAAATPRLTDGSHYSCSGAHPLPNGQHVNWQCKTKDGHTFTQVTINSHSYDLVEGRLFVVATEARVIKILQLDRAPTELKATRLGDLSKFDEVREFLGESDGISVD